MLNKDLFRRESPDVAQPAGDVPAIRIHNLTYRYPGQERAVLQDINLVAEPGQFILLMGSTGGGKSTLSLCLNGVIPRVMGGMLEGDIEVMGFSPRDKEIFQMATKIGLVFQDADSQICNIFVRDEVAFGAQNLLVPKDVILKRISRVLHFVGLDEYEDRPVFTLSGGEKQRVAIASVLAMEPGVVVFDEPTANLDPVGALEVQALIRELKGHNVTIIVIEHDVSRFVDMANRMVILAEGRIAYDGPPREILGRHGLDLRDRLGLRIPQAAEFALEAQKRGSQYKPFPLTIDDLPLNRMEFRQPDGMPGRSAATSLDSREVVIEVNDLSFAYPDGTKALESISLQVRRGEILAIVGHNGSGKTTLTSLFIGLNKPTSGQAKVIGMDVNQATIKELARKVGYVFQYPEHQFITDTVFNEMAFGLQRQEGLTSDQVTQQAVEMLELFQLDHLKDRHPFALSRGQKRRLSVASMLLLKPEIFILDEPTTGQDLRSVNQVMDYLLKLNEEGLTIILVTHDMELVVRYARTVLALEKGRVAFHGSPWQLFGEELAAEHRYGLAMPDILELYRRLKVSHPWMPPVTSPQELADLLVEKG